MIQTTPPARMLAQAGVAQARASLGDARAAAARTPEMERQRLVSRADGDDARSALRRAEAQPAAAQGGLKGAVPSRPWRFCSAHPRRAPVGCGPAAVLAGLFFGHPMVHGREQPMVSSSLTSSEPGYAVLTRVVLTLAGAMASVLLTALLQRLLIPAEPDGDVYV